MSLRYLRFNLFSHFLKSFSHGTRLRRMKSFSRIMNLPQKRNIIDLGGQPMIWDHVSAPQNLTILNLPGTARKEHRSHHQIRYVDGDACGVSEFGDKSFDMVFSNSVIEHVGSREKIAAFAREVRRLGKSYWVQTPAIWFPIEPHCGMPLWWFYPEALRKYFLKRWKKKLPAWTEMVEGTTILHKKELRALFPEAIVMTEYALGIPKSYILYRPGA